MIFCFLHIGVRALPLHIGEAHRLDVSSLDIFPLEQPLRLGGARG